MEAATDAGTDREPHLEDLLTQALAGVEGAVFLAGAPDQQLAAVALAGALRDAGAEIVLASERVPEALSSEPDVASAPPSRRGFAAAVVLAPAPPPAAELADLHQALAPKGKLALVLPGNADPELSAATCALYEERFAVFESRPIGGGSGRSQTVVLARRAEHRIRSYREGDEGAIRDLFRRTFQQDRPRSHWRWKYLEAPYGALRISVAESPGGEIVAHYAGYPLHLHDAARRSPPGLEDTAHHIGDTMTASAARRVGRGSTSLLARTMRHFFAAYCEGRIGMNFGFNTGRIHRYYRRSVNDDRHAPVTYRVRPLEVPCAERRTDRGPWTVDRAKRVDHRFDELFARARDAYDLLVVRDATYLAWRYLRRPDVTYELWTVRRGPRLAGWGVFRREEGPEGRRLIWGDALFDPELRDAARALLERVAEENGAEGEGWIEGWFPPRPLWWDRLLRELGFVEHPEPQDIGLVYLPFLRDPAEDLTARLYYTKGDSDLF